MSAVVSRQIWVHLAHERTKPSGLLPMAEVVTVTRNTLTVQKLYGPKEPVSTRREADNAMLPILAKYLREHGIQETEVEVYTKRE
jgi:hypothetical protein